MARLDEIFLPPRSENEIRRGNRSVAIQQFITGISQITLHRAMATLWEKCHFWIRQISDYKFVILNVIDEKYNNTVCFY